MNYLSLVKEGIENRKETRVNTIQVKWTKTKQAHLKKLTEYIYNTSELLQVHFIVLCNAILNRLFPVTNKHAPLHKAVFLAEEYLDSLSNNQLTILRLIKELDIPFITEILNQWNLLISDDKFNSLIVQQTGRRYNFNTAWQYSPDYMAAANLVANVKYFNIPPKTFVANLKKYVIIGCKHYSQSDFYKDFKLYHIAGNSMPKKLLPKLKFVAKPEKKEEVKQVEVDLVQLREEIKSKFGMETLPDELTELQKKRIKNYIAFIDVFYAKKKLPIGFIYKRKPTTVITPTRFKSVQLPVRVAVRENIDEIEVIRR